MTAFFKNKKVFQFKGSHKHRIYLEEK